MCGTEPTCGTSCGSCPSGQECNASGQCFDEAILFAPLSLDFELDAGGLHGTGDWEWGEIGTWNSTECSTNKTQPTAAHSGTGLWGTIINGCYNPLNNADEVCNNLDPNNDSVLSFMVQIPDSWTHAELSFYEWNDLFLPYDWKGIRVDGFIVAQTCIERPPAWIKRTLNLAAYTGKTVTITIHMMATANINLSGLYIDDLAITGN